MPKVLKKMDGGYVVHQTRLYRLVAKLSIFTLKAIMKDFNLRFSSCFVVEGETLIGSCEEMEITRSIPCNDDDCLDSFLQLIFQGALQSLPSRTQQMH